LIISHFWIFLGSFCAEEYLYSVLYQFLSDQRKCTVQPIA